MFPTGYDWFSIVARRRNTDKERLWKELFSQAGSSVPVLMVFWKECQPNRAVELSIDAGPEGENGWRFNHLVKVHRLCQMCLKHWYRVNALSSAKRIPSSCRGFISFALFFFNQGRQNIKKVRISSTIAAWKKNQQCPFHFVIRSGPV